MLVKIPFMAAAEDAAPLRQCIATAAREAGMSEHLVAILMSRFFEEISEQVSRGRVVRIPGFGIFGPRAWTPRNAGLPYCFPAFSAARGFREQTKLCCPVDGAATEAVSRHRRHHHTSSRPERAHCRPFTAMRAFRSRVRAEASRIGQEIGAD